jgi:hypothetical protein
MKNMLLRISRFVQFLLLSVVCANSLSAQTEAESPSGGIQILSPDSAQHWDIPSGSTIDMKFYNDRRIYRELHLDRVTDSMVVVNDDTFGLDKVEKIIHVREKMRKAGRKLFWISVLTYIGSGIAAIALVGLLFSNGGMTILAVFGLLLVGIASAFAPSGIIVGVVLMIVAKKAYDLTWRWKARIIPPTKTQ